MLRCLALLLALVPIARGQTPAEAPGRLWLGTGFAQSSAGLGVYGHWTYPTGGHVLSLRGVAAATLNLLSVAPPNVTSDVGLLYGRRLRDSDDVFISAGAGLGVVSVSSGDERRNVAGIPVDVQIGARLTKAVGVGMYVFGNVNRLRPFGGVGGGVQIGVLR